MPAPWIPPPITTRSYRSKPGSPFRVRVDVRAKLPYAPRIGQALPVAQSKSGEPDAEERPGQNVGRIVASEEDAAHHDPHGHEPDPRAEPPVPGAHDPRQG